MSSKSILVVAAFFTTLAAQEPAAPPASQAEKNRLLQDHFDAGLKAESAKDWSAALASFRQAAALGPNQSAVWAHIAVAAQKLAKQTTDSGQRDQLRAESLAAFDKAIALKPNDASFHNNYALALAAGGDFNAAREQLDTAVRLDPQKAGQYYYNLGAVAVNSNRNQEGCDAFAAGLQADPNFAGNHYENGLCLFIQATVRADGKTYVPPGAREGLSEYLRLSPSGSFAAFAGALLDSLDVPVETKYVRPGYRPPASQGDEATRFRGQVSLARETRPVYPSLAKRARVQGTVRLQALIDRAGEVAALNVISGHPLLVPAAMAAVKEWRYYPKLLNGEAVELATTIDVHFRMSQ